MEGGWKREEKWGKTKNGKGIAKREEHQPQYCSGRGEGGLEGEGVEGKKGRERKRKERIENKGREDDEL